MWHVVDNHHCPFRHYSAPVGERNIAISLSVYLSVRLSVCVSVREHISGTAGPIFTKLFVQIPCHRGSVFFWRRCDMLCFLQFYGWLTFGRNGPYGDAWKAEPQPTTVSGVAIPGRSLMSMNVLLVLLFVAYKQWTATFDKHWQTATQIPRISSNRLWINEIKLGTEQDKSCSELSGDYYKLNMLYVLERFDLPPCDEVATGAVDGWIQRWYQTGACDVYKKCRSRDFLSGPRRLQCNAVAASIKHQSGPSGVVCSALFPGLELDANALCKCVTNREHRLQSHLNNAATEKPSELTCLSHESSPCLYCNLINCTFMDDVHCVDGKKNERPRPQTRYSAVQIVWSFKAQCHHMVTLRIFSDIKA